MPTHASEPAQQRPSYLCIASRVHIASSTLATKTTGQYHLSSLHNRKPFMR